MSGRPFRCAVLGAESLAIQCGQILIERGHEIVAFVTDTPALESWAREQGVDVIDPRADLADALGEREFDYLFSITHLGIIPEAVLALPSRRAINFHDGPLPRYAGLYTPAWALLKGESEYGISYHEMTAQIDEGDVLVQLRFELADDETSLTLNTRCYEAGIEGFGQLVEALAEDRVQPLAQDRSQRSYFGKFDRPDAAGALVFDCCADELIARVRALDFGRYDNPLAAAKLHHAGRVLTVGAARRVETDSRAGTGTLLSIEPDSLTVRVSDGAIAIGAIRTTGGQPLTPVEAADALGATAGQTLDGVGPDLLQRIDAANARLCRSEAFWIRRLSGLAPPDVPYVHSERAVEPASEFESRSWRIPSGCDADACATAAIAYLVRISGQSTFDLAYSDDALDSLRDGIEGWVADWLPLRVECSGEISIEQHVTAAAREFGRVRERSGWLADVVARTPALAADPLLSDGRCLPVAIQITGSTAAPVAGTQLLLRIAPDGSGGELIFDPRLVGATDIDALCSQLERFAATFHAADSGALVSELPLLDDGERRQLLVDWNDTDVDAPLDRCVHELFGDQAARTPDDSALSFGPTSLTYRELERRANQLAHQLRGRGVWPDKLVGIFVERSLELVVSVLAVQKAGGGYLPLDPDYPKDRIAHMLQDSGAALVVTQPHLLERLPVDPQRALCVEPDWQGLDDFDDSAPESGVTSSNIAYVIYTSGSTGVPKGVVIEHRNVVNFFAGMDACIERGSRNVWLAVTSLSFDISVLELFWTLARGFHVVIYADAARGAIHSGGSSRPIDFGLFMWGSDDAQGTQKYELMLESAKFGDRNGFSSIWTPERHFHAFGGPYPNPSLTSAAVAAVTERIAIRAGSCVLPLHHPVRVAEEWAVVDNLSNGRVGVAFASGWQPNDFVIRPESHKDAKTNLYEGIDTVQRLWRGEKVEFSNPMGEQVATPSLPRPVQAELPTWVTTAGNPESFRQAGTAGANLLTHLLGQTVEEVAEKIHMYRQARADAGFDPNTGIVTLMLHTLVGEDDDEVREIAREPMKSYLASSVALVKDFAWAFPAFERPGGHDSKPDDIDLNSLTAEEHDAIVEFAFERYFESSGLFGSVDTCLAMVESLRAIGVDEIGCLIDYGVPTDIALASLEHLDALRRAANRAPATPTPDIPDESFSSQMQRHGVSHMQCTPSMAKMLIDDPDAAPALRQLSHLMVGGEAFPKALSESLGALPARLTNMYGPTETTIWSSVCDVEPDTEISIGRPIANTQLYIVDSRLQPVPVGVAGELLIGGAGVVRGYLDRDELTAERFIANPFDADGASRLYRTGDRARYCSDGRVEFLGRMDHQVKVRGYRVELGEIEARLGEQPGIRECVVVVREDVPGDQRLVAYAVGDTPLPSAADLRSSLGEHLPDFMVPSAYCFLDAMPLTPNRKIDRNALPAPSGAATEQRAEYREPDDGLERTVAEIWQSVLHLDTVGSRDNFFDLGGHSLLVVQVHRALRSQTDIAVSLTDLYRFPTIHALVEHMTNGGGGAQAATAGKSRAEKRRAAREGRRRDR